MVEENLEDREIRVMSEKLKVGILGGTGMVGQRFISLFRESSMVRGNNNCKPAQEVQARHTRTPLVIDGKWTHQCLRQLRKNHCKERQ